jgi:polysaccharide pyruvyl transferase WcaK-like protein
MTTRQPWLADLPEPILVVGGYGYGNVGDEAMLGGLLRLLAGKRVTVVSRRPATTTSMYGVPAVSIGAAAVSLLSHRTVLIGGGSLFAREMGRAGRLLPRFGLLARFLGRRVAIVGVGLDASTPESAAPLVRRLFAAATPVVVRDRASAQLLASWDVPAAVGPDLSAYLDPSAPEVGERLLRSAGLDPERPIVGLCLTAIDALLADAVAIAVAACVGALPGLQFCFIPMSRHPFVPAHDDVTFARRLQELAPSIRILEGAENPADLLSVFAHLSVAVCMRYHSLLFAARSGVPIVPIAYAPKCRVWLEEHGLASVTPDATAIREQIEAAVAATARA